MFAAESYTSRHHIAIVAMAGSVEKVGVAPDPM